MSRGRPPVAVEEWEAELRLTPIDGKPITNWKVLPLPDLPSISALAVFEEGGEGTGKQLHYHAVVRTTRSLQMLRKWCYDVCRAEGNEGNKVQRVAKPHDGTYGYIAKHKQLKHLHGYTQLQVEQWYQQSDEYVASLKRDRETFRKQKALGRKRQLKIVEEVVEERLKEVATRHEDDPYWTSQHAHHLIVEEFISECAKREFDFPTLTQMEQISIRLLYPRFPNLVHAIYRARISRHLENAIQADVYHS